MSADTTTRYQTDVTAKSSTLPVTLGDAKLHLRVNSSDLDTHIQDLLAAATEYCEDATSKSFRTSMTVTQSYPCWPCGKVLLDRQPVLSVTSVKYYDETGTLQTVATNDYRLHKSAAAVAYLEFDDEFSGPTYDARDNAVVIEYEAGYTTTDDVPARAKHAIKLVTEGYYAGGEVEKGNRDAVERLLDQIGSGTYR